MIVIDVGAMPHPPEESTYFLADKFKPPLLYAFDLGPWFKPGAEDYKTTRIIRDQRAAWVFPGYVPYRNEGMCSGVISHGNENRVECFDLAEFILDLDLPVILKLDCEGAEYMLMPHLKETGAEKLIELVLIEWHAEHLANGWWVTPAERVHLDCEEVDWNDLTGLETVNH